MGSSSALPAGLDHHSPSQLFTQIDPKGLKPHPRNSSIYGKEENVDSLIEMIKTSRWFKPLVATPAGTIISGHRRWKAALELGLESVPVEVIEFPDEWAELEALLLENASRLKTTEQKVREGEAWQELEVSKAKIRQKSHLKVGDEAPVRENFPARERGRVRDAIASRVGIGSGRTYQKAAKVVTRSDQEAVLGHKEVAQVLLKTLNEQSVDAAHALLKKPPEEMMEIAELITSGKAKSPRQALKMINQNNSAADNNADSSEPSKPCFAGFSVGDWVEISENAHAHNKTYVGQRGRVEQLLAAEKQISVSIEALADKIRFEPCELCLLVRSAPQNPVRTGDIVFIHIERHEAASPEQRKWNGFWGKVTKIGEMGSVSIDVGSESLQLFPRDLKPVDVPSGELLQVVERVLHLRRLKLDEMEQNMLDWLQRREWFSPNQLIHLETIEKLYPGPSNRDPSTNGKSNGHHPGYSSAETHFNVYRR